MKGKCCDGDVEVGTHCPECGSLMLKMDTITDALPENLAEYPLSLPTREQNHFIKGLLKDHINECDRCSAQRLLYEQLLDDNP